LLWLASLRPEYFAPLILFSLFFAFYFYKNRPKLRFDTPFAFRSAIFLILILSLSGYIVFLKKSRVSFDKYLLLGLNQCYASLYSKIHLNEKFSPMVEYSSLTDKVFNNPTGFIDACGKNPYEVSKYLLLNGAINSVILVPGLIRHRSLIMPVKYGKKGEILQICIFLSIFISGTMVFLFRNNTKLQSINTDSISVATTNLDCSRVHVGRVVFANLKPKIIRIISDPRIIPLLLFTTASLAAILLLIPDPRYWITFIPILFVWIAWSITNLLECTSPKKQMFIAIPVIMILSFPMFIFHSSNNRIMYEMRKAEISDKVPVIGGLYPGGLSFLAFPEGNSVVGVEQLSQEKISGLTLDFLIVDKYFRQSAFWDKNRDFMEQFEQSPEKYGYRRLVESTDKHETVVYVEICGR